MFQEQTTMINTPFIPGIYNYCDRWCERCQYINRCHIGSDDKVLQMELKMELAENDEEEQNVIFDHLKDSLADVKNLIKEQIEISGKSWQEFLKDIEENPYVPPAPTKHQEQLETLALDYGKWVSEWRAQNNSYFQEENMMELVLTSEKNPERLIHEINEAFQIIQYYQFFIGAKIHRMIHGKLEHWEDDDPIQNDWHGSAKISIVAIEKSQKAWLQLSNFFPDLADSILDNLAWLDRVKRGVLKEVPDALGFVRPGFDTNANYPMD